MTDTAPIGARIQHLRREQGLTQIELAHRVGLSQPRVSQIESGAANAPLPLRTLVAFADALGVTLADLGTVDASADDGPHGDQDVRASWSAPTELPVSLVAPIGRETDLAIASDLLVSPEVRLLTLIGPGGIGKSLLGLHLAANARAAFGRVACV